jgi:riboflavin kinase / FMN adenylyltransferase
MNTESPTTELSLRSIMDLPQLSSKGTVVTIGTFDGVHRGHRHLLSEVIRRARDLELGSAVVTFEPIPVSVLRPERFAGRICSPRQKIELLELTGVTEIVVIRFDFELAALSPETFLEHLHTSLDIRELWVGDDFALGRNRSGNIERLTQIGIDFRFPVVAVPRIGDAADPISSSAIRTAIMQGDTEIAWRLLGRPFRLNGEVVHGAHLGRKIGYPTANFFPPPDIIPLADGIYASLSTLPGVPEPLPAMTYVGTRPTVDGGARQVETNIFDFNGDIYGTEIIVDLLGRLRPDEVFSSLDELVDQLGRDEEEARAYLSKALDHGTVRI